MLQDWRVQRPDLDAAAMGIVLRVLRTARELEDRLKAALEPHGLAPFEFDVLSALRRAGPDGARSAGELCRAAQLTSGAMTHRLDQLEERGFVLRREGAGDRRRVTVALTPAGRAAIDAAIVARMADAAACVADLPRGDRRELERLLRALGASMEGDRLD